MTVGNSTLPGAPHLRAPNRRPQPEGQVIHGPRHHVNRIGGPSYTRPTHRIPLTAPLSFVLGHWSLAARVRCARDLKIQNLVKKGKGMVKFFQNADSGKVGPALRASLGDWRTSHSCPNSSASSSYCLTPKGSVRAFLKMRVQLPRPIPSFGAATIRPSGPACLEPVCRFRGAPFAIFIQALSLQLSQPPSTAPKISLTSPVGFR